MEMQQPSRRTARQAQGPSSRRTRTRSSMLFSGRCRRALGCEGQDAAVIAVLWRGRRGGGGLRALIQREPAAEERMPRAAWTPCHGGCSVVLPRCQVEAQFLRRARKLVAWGNGRRLANHQVPLVIFPGAGLWNWAMAVGRAIRSEVLHDSGGGAGPHTARAGLGVDLRAGVAARTDVRAAHRSRTTARE